MKSFSIWHTSLAPASLLRVVGILVAFALLWSTSLRAQTESDFSWGVKGGIVYGGPIPNDSNPDSTHGAAGLGPTLGLTFSYHLSDRFRLIAEVGYSMKSVEYQRHFRQDILVALE